MGNPSIVLTPGVPVGSSYQPTGDEVRRAFTDVSPDTPTPDTIRAAFTKPRQ